MSKLIEVETAWQRIDDCLADIVIEPIEVDVQRAVSMVLAAEVKSDVDVPPYRKALMDGYAVRAEDVAPGRKLPVVDQIHAGDLPSAPLQRGTAVRIMTGAPLPQAADAVVPVEQTDGGDETVTFVGSIAAGANLMDAGYCIGREETIVPVGRIIEAHQVGLLCEVGASQVCVVRPPRVAVLATGDELVSPAELPGPGQIRNTNAPLLAALAERDGAHATQLGVASDQAEELGARIQRGLQHDVLILSGGVSAGVRDLVPSTLAALGVRQVFHGVRLKPGKPVWFGVRGGSRSTLVFGLPGNPMSSLVCYELLVRRAVDRLCGRGVVDRWETRVVAEDFAYRGSRRTFHPARLVGREQVRLLSWKGSVDQRVLVETNALVDLAEGKGVTEGTAVRVYRL